MDSNTPGPEAVPVMRSYFTLQAYCCTAGAAARFIGQLAHSHGLNHPFWGENIISWDDYEMSMG